MLIAVFFLFLKCIGDIRQYIKPRRLKSPVQIILILRRLWQGENH